MLDTRRPSRAAQSCERGNTLLSSERVVAVLPALTAAA